jgi:RNA polymerase sigma-70 factor (ECF subfamily)
VHPQESDLIRQAQAGQAQAFSALVEAHQRFVYNLALRTLGDPQEAEDVAQESFVRAWLALPNFRGAARFATWLYRIVTNLCYTRLPRLRRELSVLGEERLDDFSEDDVTPGDPAASLDAAERRAFLHRQIDRLPESYRLLITLRYQQDLSYEEIASVVSLPLGTVKTGLFRAKERLRRALADFEEGRQ